MKPGHRTALITLVSMFTLLAAACGGGSNTASPDHNDQDVEFANGMIPHHAQALEMSRIAETRATRPEVVAVAKHIEDAQQPEIDTMNRWLEAWGEPTVDASAEMDHGSHAGHVMEGMLSDDEMKTLEGASGADFDRLFLTGMIKHHEGAVEMARVEQTKGKSTEAKTLADSIIAHQQSEIDDMRKLLG